MSDGDNDDKFVEEMLNARTYGDNHPGLAELWEADPEYSRRFDQMAEYVIRRDDALSRKQRELFIAGWAATAYHVEICKNHIGDALEHGASHGELLQTFQLAAHVGGAPSLTIAGEALSDLGITLEPETDTE